MKIGKSSKAFAKALESVVNGTDLSGQVQTYYENLAALENIAVLEKQDKSSDEKAIENMENIDEQLSTAYDFHQKQDIMDSNVEPQSDETQEKFEDFAANGAEITENIESESNSLSDAEDQYEEFQDNTTDLTNDTTDSGSDVFQEFEENRRDFTEPNSTEELYEEFSENTSDITGQTDTQSEYDESNYDLKP